LVEPDRVQLLTLLERQRQAWLDEGEVRLETRRDRLARCAAMLRAAVPEICDALAADFGQRPAEITQLTDLFPSIAALDHARRHLPYWARRRRCSARIGLPIPGARAEVVFQPLGVVGIVSPWNFPINLSFSPLAGALAAGNRCMLKPSEHTPATSALIARLVASRFDPLEVSVCTGSAAVAVAFTSLPFDHLLFTGSTEIGRRVMGAAAEGLVPVTLELGGKCPAIIGRSARLEQAVDRLLLAKSINAGQICLAPDYVFVPRDRLAELISLSRAWWARHYGPAGVSADTTAVISATHAARLREWIEEARRRGANVVSLGDEPSAAASKDADGVASRLLPLTLVTDPPADCRLAREEIFGPVLPLLPYDDVDAAIARVRAGPRPLALYYFGNDRHEERRLLAGTLSGGVTINDAAMHTVVEELPFGGVGASGMGAYHGEYGFRTFSHARAIYRQTPLDVASWLGLRPPYGPRTRRALKFLLGR
jgi:coniferyl-aldehyde dehydrogenase